MKKNKLLLTLLVGMFALVLQAQTITGSVTDENGVPLPGATVLVEGTTNGVSTDFGGNFSIEASQEDRLVFSYVGYSSQTLSVGNNSQITVQLQPDNALEEVVVTALGIRKAEKTLSYANQTVSSEDLTITRDVNFVNSITGKVAGVEIRKSSSGPGGSTKVQIRGSKSLSGDSQPLFVIDGIPLVNNRGNQPGVWDGVDQGDGLSQLNPDDIESLSVLKGANAAVLYGSQGANGVVIITTKSGKQGKTQVQINSGTTFESIIELPDLQYRYGSTSPGAAQSWSTTKGNYDDTFVEDFFRTGVNYFNSVSISGGNEKTTAYFSYANTSATGVLPTTTYAKNNLSFKQSTKLLNDKLMVTSNLTLAKENSYNRARAGYYDNPLTGLYWYPRDLDFDAVKNNYSVFNPDRNTNEMNWHIADHLQSNPYWLINNQSQEDFTNRLIGSLNLEYAINEAFKFQLRGNYDYSVKEFNNQRKSGGNTTTVPSKGRWVYQKYDDTSVYTDGILSYNKDFDDISVSALVGGSFQRTIFRNGVSVDTGGSADGLAYANEFYFQNLLPVVQVRSTLGSDIKKQSFFGNVELGYKDMVFFNLAGRNDFASTLALTGNDSYFYPSFGITVLLDEMFDLPDFISLAKIRASSANVGNEVPYNTIFPRHTINSDGSVGFNTTKPFFDAKPEIIRTTELGLDWRFFNNRLGIDFTYYDINSQDQFIRINQPIEDFTSFFVNAGEITNKGVELVLNAKPILKEEYSWTTGLNYTQNRNKIVELHPDTQLIGQGGSEGIRVQLVEGGSISDIYSIKFIRDDLGRIVIGDDGRPTKTGTRELVGNAEPDFQLGWSNTFHYKTLSLNFQINGKFGGYVWSQTEAMLDGYGVSERSALARDRGFEYINGVKNGSPVSQIDPFDYYSAIGERNGIAEAYIYDRTSVRLAQLAISKTINVDKFDWISRASVSFIGNNLFYFYKDAPFDPELQVGTGRNDPGVDSQNVPSTRTYGFNLSLTF